LGFAFFFIFLPTKTVMKTDEVKRSL